MLENVDLKEFGHLTKCKKQNLGLGRNKSKTQDAFETQLRN